MEFSLDHQDLKQREILRSVILSIENDSDWLDEDLTYMDRFNYFKDEADAKDLE
jgi:hypothetical protein